MRGENILPRWLQSKTKQKCIEELRIKLRERRACIVAGFKGQGDDGGDRALYAYGMRVRLSKSGRTVHDLGANDKERSFQRQREGQRSLVLGQVTLPLTPARKAMHACSMHCTRQSRPIPSVLSTCTLHTLVLTHGYISPRHSAHRVSCTEGGFGRGGGNDSTV